MTAPDFRARNAAMAAHYSSLVKRYGESPRAAQWRGANSQEKRFDVLFAIGDLSRAKILDFGCGQGALLGALLRRMPYAGEYVGYDVSEAMLKTARAKFPGARFENVDIFDARIRESFDYVFASGTFNNEHPDARRFFRAAVPRLFAMASQGMAFNALSARTERHVVELIYLDPEETLDWIKREITPHAELRNDYRIEDERIPEDFTIFMRRV